MKNFSSPAILRLCLATALSAAPLAKGDVTLTVNPGESHQSIEGFGTCLISWLPDVNEFYRQKSFPQFYCDELGASVLRIELWPGTVAVEKENWEDISYRDFTFTGPGERGGVYVDVAERLNAQTGGKLKIIGSAWTPPAWMKINGQAGNGRTDRKSYALKYPQEQELWNGPLPDDHDGERYRYIGRNKLRPDRYLHFAKVLVEWTRFFRSRGMNFFALSPQNELLFSHWYNGCVYTPAEYAELLRVIDWMFQHEGVVKPKIFGPEHMAGRTPENKLYLEAIFNLPEGKHLLDAVAAHGYTDGVERDRRPESAAAFAKFGRLYEKPVWMTEGTTGDHGWPGALNDVGVMMMTALTDGEASLVTPWQVVDRKANDEALMGLDGPTKKTYTTMQYWRFIRPGMVRIGIAGGLPTMMTGAFLDPVSNRMVLVILNRKATSETVTVKSAANGALRLDEVWLTDGSHNCARLEGWPQSGEKLEVPAQSIATLLLSPSKP